MIRNRFKIITPLLAVLSLVTCSLPPYNEGLSLGVGAAKKMVELGAEHITVGPIWIWDFDFRNREYYFMPNKAIGGPPFDPEEFKNGYIVSVDDRSFDLSFVEFFPGPPEDYYFYRGWGEGIENDDPDSNNYFAETVKGAAPFTSPFLLNFIRFDAKDYRNNDLRVIQWPPSPDWEVDPGTIDPDLPNLRNFIYYQWFDPMPEKWPTIIGASITPIDGPDDWQVFFCKFEGSGDYAEVFYSTSSGSGLNIGGWISHDDLDFNFPDEVENGFYHYAWSLDLSFFSYYSKTQRKYKNYRWGPGGPGAVLTPLVKMDRRIDTALSNGKLLSFDDNRCYVYNSDGEKQYDFLVGGLHFCYEIYLDGLPHVVFTLPAMLTVHDNEDELYFNVYAFPTERLAELQ